MTYVDKGEKAPFAGFLMTPQKEYAIREDREIQKDMLDNYKIRTDILSQITDNQNKQIQVMADEHLKLQEDLSVATSKQKWAFVAGVVATLGGVYVINNIK